MMQPLAAMTAPLQRYFTARLAADEPVRLEGPERIAIGHSRAMLGVAVDFAIGGREQRREFVLRVEQGGVFGTESEREVRVMRAVHAAGIPVAPVRFFEPDASVIGAPFFVMDRIHGEAGGAGEGALRECVRLLQRQHALDWRGAGLDFLGVPATPRDAPLAQIARWEGLYRESRYLPVPLLEEGAAWLRHHAPTPERVVLVHGDPGPGNFIHRGESVRAVTDWEFAHLGDPNEDWVYLATVRGGGRSREEWRRILEAEAGVEISDASWHFWDVFNQFKGACANLTALRVFCDGANPAPNMAAVGTSVHLLLLRRMADLVGQG